MDWFSDPERYGQEIAKGWQGWKDAEAVSGYEVQKYIARWDTFNDTEAMWQKHPHYKAVPKWT